jgi:hypothetical protein
MARSKAEQELINQDARDRVAERARRFAALGVDDQQAAARWVMDAVTELLGAWRRPYQIYLSILHDDRSQPPPVPYARRNKNQYRQSFPTSDALKPRRGYLRR